MIAFLSRRRALMLAAAGSFLVSGIASAESADDVRAPFGLTWGMSSDDVRKLGVHLTPSAERPNDGVSFAATELSKVLSDTETVVLFFGYRDKLWRVAAVGGSLGPDPSGSQAVARYRELASSLSERYGPGVESDTRDRELWKGANQYVMSLRQGRAHRYTTFRSSTVDVELSVRASDSDRAYYVILFAHRPGAQEFEADKKAHEKDAL